MPADNVSCSGFIAWWESGKLVATGNTPEPDTYYIGQEGTISAKASSFEWNAEVWDLTGDVPVLR